MTEYPAAFVGEPVKKVFPVRAQLTWFRLKNPTGDIVTEIVKNDEFMAIVKATVSVDGRTVANAHGSADSNADGVNGFKLIETAESRAISRALDFAGFGCQLDLKTFDGSQPEQPDAPQNEAPISNGDVTFPNEAPSTPIPGTLKGKMKVNANAASSIVDIKDIEVSQPAPNEPPAKKARVKNKPEVAGEQAPSTPAPDTVSEDGTDKPDAKKQEDGDGSADNLPEELQETTAATKDATNESTPGQSKTQPEGSQDASESNAAEYVQNNPAYVKNSDDAPKQLTDAEDKTPAKPTEGSVEEKPSTIVVAAKAAQQLVQEHIAMVIGNDLPKPAFDAQFFGDGKVDPNEMYINPTAGVGGTGKKTKMSNLELQLAISFLQAHPEVINDLFYPATGGTYVGKPFGIIRTDVKSSAEVFSACKKLYVGNNAAAYAAVLILAS